MSKAAGTMKVLGLAGWSGSGKTALITRLIPALGRRGLTVSTVKHAHASFEIDHPGKDSYKHRRAGAREVLIASGRRWALMHEEKAADPDERSDFATLLARLSPVDLVLVEGFKFHPHPKIEVHREVNGKPFLHPEDPHIIALATEAPPRACPLPVFPLDDGEGIAAFIAAALRDGKL